MTATLGGLGVFTTLPSNEAMNELNNIDIMQLYMTLNKILFKKKTRILPRPFCMSWV